MSLVPTPMLDTLVQLTNNDVNPNDFDLNDPNALALAAVAAVDAEDKAPQEGDAASTCSADSGGVGGLSSFSEQVGCSLHSAPVLAAPLKARACSVSLCADCIYNAAMTDGLSLEELGFCVHRSPLRRSWLY